MSRVRLIAAAVAVALVVVCPFASAAGAPLFPVTVTAANGSVALTERPDPFAFGDRDGGAQRGDSRQ
jgi:hypothetical protein